MSGALRAATDVGGTFTDLVAFSTDRGDRAPGDPHRQGRHDAPRLRARRAGRALEERDHDRGRRLPRPRDDARDQRDHGAEGGQDRPDHDRRVPRLAGDRPWQPPRLLQPPLPEAAPVRAPLPPAGGPGPPGARRPGAGAARSLRAALDRRGLPRGRRRGGRHLPASRLRRSEPRGGGARGRRRSSGRRSPSSRRTRSRASGASTSARAPPCCRRTCSRSRSSTSRASPPASAPRGSTDSSTSCSRTAASTPWRRRSEIPITMVESGPASGFWGAAELGRLIGEPNVLALDIGGTTAKCSLIEGGHVKVDLRLLDRAQPPLGGLSGHGPGGRPGGDRKRRRQHRLGRRLREAARRAAVGRRRSRAGRLRTRRHRGDHDRREPRARPHQPRLLLRRRARRRHGGRRRGARRRRGATGGRPCGGRPRHRPDREQQHGQRAEAGLAEPRLRPA